MQMRQGNNVSTAFAQNSTSPIFNKLTYNTMAQTPIPPSQSFYFPTSRMRWTGKQPFSNYSRLVKIAEVVDKFEDAGGMPGIGLPFALLSDGSCASACINFAALLNKDYGIPVVNVGAPSSAAHSFGTACGGWAIGSANRMLICKASNRASGLPEAPKLIQYASDLSLPVNQMFVPGNESLPCEYVMYRPTVQLTYTRDMITDFGAMWAAAARSVWKD